MLACKTLTASPAESMVEICRDKDVTYIFDNFFQLRAGASEIFLNR